MIATTPQATYALGFSLRKRALVCQFLGQGMIRFVSSDRRIPDGSVVAVWASGPYGIQWAPVESHARFSRVFLEDGFLRSVGLGADLVKPLSWVVDERGIYYDASRASDLEFMLQENRFDTGLLQRAAALRGQLVASKLTKYNVGAQPWQRPLQASGQELVMVVGQVETDAAIRLGAPGIKTNLALLKAARAAHPHAWLIYKPHPDVVAGLRKSGENEAEASNWCNEVITDAPMGDMLAAVDAVHVLSSLAGFEALLRNKTVFCHGLPFYAGWGLTIDALALPRRSRRLSLDELVAGALLEYPRYVSRATGAACTAEQALQELIEWKAGASNRVPFWRKMLRYFIRQP